MVTHKGGCHCGRVRFEFEAAPVVNVSECNCSICSKSGMRGLILPKERFRLVSGEDSLSEYTFDSGEAKHLFCSHCGIKSFYYPRSHPDGVSINARCLDAGTVEKMNVTSFDGQNWEQQYPAGRAETYPN